MPDTNSRHTKQATKVLFRRQLGEDYQ